VYVDENGEFVHLIIGAIFGGFVNWAAHGAEFTLKGFGYFSIGAAAGALGAGIGSGVNSLIAGKVGGFGAGFLGKATGLATGFASGFVTGASGGFTSKFISGFGNSAMIKGNNIGDMLKSGWD
jgi:hypothetical protein